MQAVNGASGGVVLMGGGRTPISRSGDTINISSVGGGGTGIQGVQNTDGTMTITNPNGPIATLNIANGSISTSKPSRI